jgi:predicted secreted protein
MAKYSGKGVTLKKGDGEDPEVFAAVAQIVNFTPPQFSRETVDVTDRDSAGSVREFLGSLKDYGECTVAINYDPALHNAWLTDADSDDPINYQITYPGSQVQTAALLITGFAPDAPMDGALTASVTFKVSGKPDWA